MDTYQIEVNGITFEISRETDRFGTNRVIARLGDLSEIGHLAGIPSRAYPRIDFQFKTTPWLHERANSSGWILDDYETMEEAEQRPPDTCSFDLTEEEAQAITNWRLPAPPERKYEPQPRDYVEPIFGIGALNLGDGAEVQTPEPKFGKTCRICRTAESQGAMFTTMAGGDVCDDCVG